MKDTVIKVENLGKRYLITERLGPYKTLRDTLVTFMKRPLGFYRKKKEKEYIWALKDLFLEVKMGEALGVIGRNGAGKTTLLKILSRITEPTEGRVTVKGRVSSLLEVGTGFHPELTGRENVYLNGVILGMKKREVDKKFDEIISFAELEKFMDTPLKFYSSGMYVRLAFAVAAHLESDILLIDEVLAVGDMAFQRKCIAKMEELKKRDITIIFVSHNMRSIKFMCDKALWLRRGTTGGYGKPEEIINQYINSTNLELTVDETAFDISLERFGSGEIRINSIRLIGDGKETDTFNINDCMHVEINYTVLSKIREPKLWVAICDDQGRKLAGTVSELDGQKLTWSEGKGKISCIFDALPFLPGVYSLIVGILDKDLTTVPYDRWGKAATFVVQAPQELTNRELINPDLFGTFHIKSRWEF